MKYASVNGARQEAQPKLSGKCPCCESPVIAKCGTVRKPYWAHKSKKVCNSWKNKPETEWHRTWKDHFPKEWQEIIQTAENGDKHIADVKTDQGYVIEFQHSSIKLEERQSRENFYKAMIWIVDGTKQAGDKEKFINIWRNSTLVNRYEELWELKGGFEKCSLLQTWNDSSAPVFFDFGENILLGLLPKEPSGARYGVGINRNALIESLGPEKEKSFRTLLYRWMLLILKSQPKKEIALSQQRPQPQKTNYFLHRKKRF